MMPDRLTLLAVHAHPDDEAIGTGGVLARYAAEGLRVALVCATRGEVGEIVDPTMDEAAVRPRLGEVREQELRCACKALGVGDVHFLGYRDSGMMGTADNDDPRSFWQADPAEATERLVSIVRTLRPQVMVTYDANGGYGHPDHIKAHRLAVAAFAAAGDAGRYAHAGPAPWQPQKLYYVTFPRSFFRYAIDYYRQSGEPSPFEGVPVDPDTLGTPDELITTRVDVRDFLDKKLAALACHRSQVASDFFFLAPGLVERGLGFEHFILAESRVPTDLPEDDLFAGLR